MAAVISRALDDLKGKAPIKVSLVGMDRAMSFILGPDCENLCMVLDVDYPVIQKTSGGTVPGIHRRGRNQKRP
jgi:hypothetical protein